MKKDKPYDVIQEANRVLLEHNYKEMEKENQKSIKPRDEDDEKGEMPDG